MATARICDWNAFMPSKLDAEQDESISEIAVGIILERTMPHSGRHGALNTYWLRSPLLGLATLVVFELWVEICARSRAATFVKW